MINKSKAYSRFLYYLQMACIGLILFFFAVEFPSFHFETFVNFNHWLDGHRYTYHNMVVSAYPTDLIVIAMALFSLHKWKKLLFTTSAKYLVLFFLAAWISTSYSESGLSYGGAYKLFNLAIFTIFFSLLHYLFSEDTEKKIDVTFKMVLAMMLFESIFALTQYFTQTEVGWKVFERFPMSESSFGVPSKQLWRLDSLFSITRASETVIRVYGTLYHTNILGGFLFFTSMITLYGFYNAKKWTNEVLYAVLNFLNILAMCTTFSRSAIFTYLIGCSLWILTFFTKPMATYKDISKLFKLSLCLLISICLCTWLFYDQFFSRGGIINSTPLSVNGSTLPRWNSMGGTIKLILNNPLWGVGLENFSHHMGRYSLNIIVHNIYLLIASETGLIGIALFITFIWSVLKKSFQNLTPQKVTILVTFIGILCLGSLDFYMWRAPPGRWMFFLTIGLLSVLNKTTKTSQEMNELL